MLMQAKDKAMARGCRNGTLTTVAFGTALNLLLNSSCRASVIFLDYCTKKIDPLKTLSNRGIMSHSALAC